MRDINIKPQKALIVRDPVTYLPLKAEGEIKPRNAYWLRRMKEGSVIELNKQPMTSEKNVKEKTA